MRRIILLFGILLTQVSAGFNQSPNLGNPLIRSFNKETYGSGNSNWEIEQDIRGVLYFANNKGLLTFDGSIWKTYPLPNRTIVRSLAIAPNGSVYVGGQNEFGRFVPDPAGEWQYEDLRPLIPEPHRNFEDVWDIVLSTTGKLVFRASNKLYQLTGERITVIEPPEKIVYLGGPPGLIVFQQSDGQLYKLEAERYRVLDTGNLLQGKTVTDFVPFGKSWLLATERSGLFSWDGNQLLPWSTDADDFLYNQRILSLSPTLGKRLAVGTDFGGLVVFDEEGKSLYHLNRQSGILNNTVFSLHQDHYHNLWLGLSNGLSHIELNSPFSLINPDDLQDGAGFAVKIFRNKIYLGTNNGLYVNDWKDHYSPFFPMGFRLVPETKGQTWGLDIVDNELFLGHNRGAFRISDDRAVQLYSGEGIWNYSSLDQRPGYLIAGSYSDIALFKKEGDWQFSGKMEAINESCRFVEQDDRGNIWMAHPYRGIYRIQLNEEGAQTAVKRYDQRHGLPSGILNHLFKVSGEIIFCGERGVFLFDYENERFYPNEAFNELFPEQNKIRRLVEAANGDIWFVTEDELGVLEVRDLGLEKVVEKRVFPQFGKNLNAGFEAIYPYDQDNVFIASDRGFIHYSPREFLQLPDTPRIILNEVRVATGSIDSLIFAGVFWENDRLRTTQPERSIPTLKYSMNAIRFRFSTPFFKQNSLPGYRYYLEGFEASWSDWAPLDTKEYTNLSHGDYVFRVQARTDNSGEHADLSFRFTIAPPWYKSTAAYILYLLGFLFFIGLVVQIYRRKYYGLKLLSEQTIKQSEQEIGKLREEKINAELEFKKRELVSATLHLVRKNETIRQILGRIRKIKKKNTDEHISKELLQLISMMQQDELLDEGWEDLMLPFNQLHGNFFERLKEEFPNLTPKDLKMCAYLRMNLSTKELATLLNVTIRGVEASRYRLRKKLKLKKEDNLTEFMMRY